MISISSINIKKIAGDSVFTIENYLERLVESYYEKKSYVDSSQIKNEQDVNRMNEYASLYNELADIHFERTNAHNGRYTKIIKRRSKNER